MRGPVTLKRRVKRAAIRHHKQLAPLLPRGFRQYGFPGGRIYLDLRESPAMLRRVFGMYEVSKREALRRYLRPGMTFVDVGANLGDFSLLAARLMGDQGRILAIEPSPDNLGWLEKSVAANGYTSIEIVPMAVGDEEGEATLHLSALGAMHSMSAHPFHRTVGSITVPVRTLDRVLGDAGVEHVDVMKIDVEGFETEVLAGATATLGGDRPMVLLLDLHPLLVDSVAICDRLTKSGFELREPDPPFRPLPLIHDRLGEVIAVR